MAEHGRSIVVHFPPSLDRVRMTKSDDHLPPEIDCHAHIFTLTTPTRPGAWAKPVVDASAERFQRTLRNAGIARAVLAASSIHADNEYALQATETHRNLKTTVIVPPDTSADDLAHMASRGAVGIRLQWRNVADPPDLATWPWRKLLDRIGALGWHVELHDDARRLARPVAAISDAGVRLVIDHFGRPASRGIDDPDLGCVLDALGRGRTWIKLSAAFRLEPPTLDQGLARELLQTAGSDRLLWGSDWPFVGFEGDMTYDRALADFVRAVPDAAIRGRIGRAGSALYFGEADPRSAS